MKKIRLLIISALFLFAISCGEGDKKETSKEKSDESGEAVDKNVDEMDDSEEFTPDDMEVEAEPVPGAEIYLEQDEHTDSIINNTN